ncbi:MAG: hypothetical protein VX148_12430, partial [Pseudomonadota bacterium]|nr:hypothetical protein [Pseudomonadota bacterium]
MLNNLSFRAKLMLLLACAIVGFTLVTWVAIQGMNAQQEANRQLRLYGDIGSGVDKISLGILEAADQLRSLNEENFVDYQAMLSGRKNEDLEILEKDIHLVNQPELQQALQDSKDKLSTYADSLLMIAENLSIIGFDNHSGLKGEITRLGDEISTSIERLSLLKKEFINARKFEAVYLSEPSEVVLQDFQKSFARFESKVDNFGFNDSIGPVAAQYNEALMGYGPAFSALQQAEAQFDENKLSFAQAQFQLAELIAQFVK